MAEEANNTVETQAETEQQEQTFTAKDLQAEKDRAYDKARNDIQKDYEDKMAQAVAEAKEQALKESKMTAEQKAQAEYDAKVKALTEREAGIAQRELTADVTGQLSTAGLPVELAESFAVLGDSEKTSALIDSIKDLIDKQANEQIKQRANAGKPSGASSNLAGDNDPIKAALANAGF